MPLNKIPAMHLPSISWGICMVILEGSMRLPLTGIRRLDCTGDEHTMLKSRLVLLGSQERSCPV